MTDTTWEDMTEAQKDEANAEAWDGACDRLRSMQHRHPGLSLGDVRQLAADELAADMRNAQDDVRRGERKRATRMDKRSADYSRRSLTYWGRIAGFIWDAEI